MNSRTIFGLAATATLLMGCTVPPSQDQLREQSYKSQMAPYIGRRVWTASGVTFSACRERYPIMAECERYTRGQFTVDSVDGLGWKGIYVHVSFVDGPSGFLDVDPTVFAREVQDRDPRHEDSAYPLFILNPKDKKSAKVAAERRKLPGVEPGMTMAEVRESAWGVPDHVTYVKARHDSVETWEYPGNAMLYFSNYRLDRILFR